MPHRLSNRWATTLLVFFALFAMRAAPVSAAPSACDTLAASPYDPTRPPALPGVAFDRIDHDRAVAACTGAHRRAPHDARITFQLGRALMAQQARPRLALRILKEAAAAGSVVAGSSVASMYRCGRRGIARDVAAGLRWYRRAAAKGDAFAQMRLGDSYWYGAGVARDHARAIDWYRQAAAQGAPAAIEWLARLRAPPVQAAI